MAILDFVNFNGARLDLQDSASVHFDAEQELTDAQQTQARENIAAAGQEDLESFEDYVRQMSPLATVGPADIVSIEDAAPLPVEGLKVDVEPKQDLHGYENPWPAGGGVNKFAVGDAVGAIPNAAYTLSVSIDPNTEIVRIQGTASWSSSGTKSFRIISTKSGVYFGDAPVTHDYSGMVVTPFVVSKSSNIVSVNSLSYSAGEGSIMINMTTTEEVVTDISLRITIADTAPTSWSPYSNICPITGWEGATAKDEGKNLWNPTTGGNAEGTYNGITYTKNNDGSYTFNGTATSSTWINFGNITLPAGTFTASYKQSGSYTGSVTFGANNGVFIRYPALSTYPITKTSDNETTGNFGINFPINSTATNLVLWFQIEYGSTATSFTPYVPPRTASVDFGQTIYGGTVDLTRGELVVDRTMMDLGALTWEKVNGTTSQYDYFKAMFSPLGVGSTGDVLCSQYVGSSGINASGGGDKEVRIVNGREVRIRDLSYNDAATFKTAMSGVQLVYELATPVTYTLTPAELELFKGVNNISADAGQVTVTYRQDIYTALNNKINELQALVLES